MPCLQMLIANLATVVKSWQQTQLLMKRKQISYVYPCVEYYSAMCSGQEHGLVILQLAARLSPREMEWEGLQTSKRLRVLLYFTLGCLV